MNQKEEQLNAIKQQNEENEKQLDEIHKKNEQINEEKEEMKRQNEELLKKKEEEYLKLKEEMKNLKIEYPDEWTQQKEDVELFEIIPNTPTYDFVINDFRKTVAGQIISLKRIQNQWLFKKYQTELQIELEKKKKKNPLYNFDQNERFLWHGTRINPMVIVNKGFDLQYASDGGNFGKAIYFGLNARKSCGYNSFTNQNGNKFLIYAKVFVGESLNTGFKNFIKPPQKPKSEDTYDSVWYSDELGVYDMHRFYPYYLLEYK